MVTSRIWTVLMNHFLYNIHIFSLRQLRELQAIIASFTNAALLSDVKRCKKHNVYVYNVHFFDFFFLNL